MASVQVHIHGTETHSEATEIAGVDERFHHPLGRYAQDPHDWRSPLLPSRRILSKTQQELLRKLDTRIKLPTYHDQHYLTDYWPGVRKLVKAIVSEPLTTPLAPEQRTRVALVAKEFDDGNDTPTSVGTANEVLLQTTDSEDDAPFAIWQTVAGVMIGDNKREQRGFVDDLTLLGLPEATSPEVVKHATNDYLGRLVMDVSLALRSRLPS